MHAQPVAEGTAGPGTTMPSEPTPVVGTTTATQPGITTPQPGASTTQPIQGTLAHVASLDK